MINKDEIVVPSDGMSANERDRRPIDIDYKPTGSISSQLFIVTPAAIYVRDQPGRQFIGSICSSLDYRFACARFIKNRSEKTMIVTVENSIKTGCPILTLWDGESLIRIRHIRLAARLRVTCIAVSESGALIAYGAADGTVGVLDYGFHVFSTSLTLLRRSPIFRPFSTRKSFTSLL